MNEKDKKIIDEQIEILVNMSREIAEGRLCIGVDGGDLYHVLPNIGIAIARLIHAKEA